MQSPMGTPSNPDRALPSHGNNCTELCSVLAYNNPARLCTHGGCRHLAKPGYRTEGSIPPTTLWNLQASGHDLKQIQRKLKTQFGTSQIGYSRVLCHLCTNLLNSDCGRAWHCNASLTKMAYIVAYQCLDVMAEIFLVQASFFYFNVVILQTV